MFDTKGRAIVQPVLDVLAQRLIRWGWTPNRITVMACVIGVCAGVAVALGYSVVAIVLLWVSGVCDALDGTVARMTKQTSAWGTLLDITLDRVVELSIVVAIALVFEEHSFSLLVLVGTFVIAMTVFLTVGAVSTRKGEKSFYYQPGWMERTECFILFTFMIIFPELLAFTIWAFIAFECITIVQRMREAYILLK
jgi:phosphatidylglycerophosphate synthase